MKIRSTINLPWGHARLLKKFGPDRFSRFEVYWIQTNKQTPKPNLYININNIHMGSRQEVWNRRGRYIPYDYTCLADGTPFE